MIDDIDDDALGLLSKEAQLEAMEDWFRARYEDPAQRTPYESAEGGYIWIWGGPYDARWELQSRFEGIVPNAVIEELADNLSSECWEWAPVASSSDYDEELFNAVAANSRAEETLTLSLETIRKLLATSVDEELSAPFVRLLFANAIAAMETYLSDRFINRVLSSQALLQLYLDHEPKFRDKKIAYRDILRESSSVASETRTELLDTVWHNLPKVKAMYGKVLDVDMQEIGDLVKAVHVRHDIVHRNGRTKDDVPVAVSSEDVQHLLERIAQLASTMEDQIEDEPAISIDGDADF